MNWANRLAMTANIALCGAGLYFIGKYGLAADGAEWHYSDLIVILLTAVGVMITALGVGVAVMAIWGYQKITDHAVAESLRLTDARVSKRLDDYLGTQEVQDKIRALVEERVNQASDQVYADLAPSYPATEGETNG